MVVQYEPTESFNEATKTPTVAMGVSNTSQPIRNVRGAGNNNPSSTSSPAPAPAPAAAPSSPVTGSKSVSTTVSGGSNSSSAQSSAPKSNKGVASFSQGMMVK